MATQGSTPHNEPPTVGEAVWDIPPSPRRAAAWAMAAGMVAALIASAAGEATYGRFRPAVTLPANWDKLSPFEKPDVLSSLIRRGTPTAEAKNTALAYGLLGSALGGALGLAGGLARRLLRAGLAAALVGLLAGAAAGAGMSAALTPAFFRSLDPESGMLLGLLTHGGIWLPIGAAAGLAFGIGLASRRPKTIILALVGGLLGAALGTAAYEFANAIAFPTARLDRPIPDTAGSRILAVFCVAILTALGAASAMGGARAKTVAYHPLA